MTLARDDLLLDAIKESLSLYQRSLVWATTAALSGLLLTQRLGGVSTDKVELLNGSVSVSVAWYLAQLLYLIFGALAFSAIRRYHGALKLLNPAPDILEAIRLFPSLATQPGRFFRLGSVILPLGATCASWTIEIVREVRGGVTMMDAHWYLGGIVTTAILIWPYLGILRTLRELRLWMPNQQGK